MTNHVVSVSTWENVLSNRSVQQQYGIIIINSNLPDVGKDETYGWTDGRICCRPFLVRFKHFVQITPKKELRITI